VNTSPQLVLVDLLSPSVVELATTDRKIKRQVKQELRAYTAAGATDAQIERERLRQYRRIFYTPEMIATWILCKGVKEQLVALTAQGYDVILFGEHLQRSYLAIEQWIQEQLTGIPFSLALNDLPFYIKEENVFLLGSGQEIYEQAQWAFSLLLTLIRLNRAKRALVVTWRAKVREHYERAKSRGEIPLVEIQFIESLQNLASRNGDSSPL